MAQSWDEVYRNVPYTELPWEAGEAPKELVALVEGGKVARGAALDICCGAGTSSLYLAQKGFQVSGLDISAKAVDIARGRARAAQLPSHFLMGDAVHLPFANSSFDFVYDRGCFHHVPASQRLDYIREVTRVLRDGGKYQLFCFGWRERWAPNRFTRKDIHRLFSPWFLIESIKETGHQEPSGGRRHFLSAFMEKMGDGSSRPLKG